MTEGQLYDLYDGSLEHQLVDKIDKDIFGIRDMLPEQAVDVLTEETIRKTAWDLADKIEQLDNGDLGIRKELVSLGVTDRYLGLRNTLSEMGNDPKNASEEVIKKAIRFVPRELLLLILNTQVGTEDEKQFKLGLYATEIHARIYEATEDKINVESLHFAKNVLDEFDTDLTNYYETYREVIEKIELLRSFVYEELYYNPENLNIALVDTIKEDMKWRDIDEFPLNEFIVTDNNQLNPVFNAYLDIMKPIKETKALTRLWEDDKILEVRQELRGQEEVFETSKYLYNNRNLVLMRDGLTIVYPTGRFKHLASSKVKAVDIEEVVALIKNE